MPIKLIQKTINGCFVWAPAAKGAWSDKANHELIIRKNNIKSLNQYQKLFPSAVRMAQKKGFVRDLPLEYEREKKRRYSNLEQVRNEISKYPSRSTIPDSLYKYILRNNLHDLLDEQFPTHATQDRDIFYLIKLKHFQGKAQLVKVGVTSFHLGDQRITKFEKLGYSFDGDPSYWYSKHASQFEKFALNLGADAHILDNFDGYSEHRYYHEADFRTLNEELKVGRAERVHDFSESPDSYERVIKKINNVVKFKGGFAARENRNKQIAVFRTKFDAILCKGLHLEGGVLREFALQMKVFNETPLWQTGADDNQRPFRYVLQTKKSKVRNSAPLSQLPLFKNVAKTQQSKRDEFPLILPEILVDGINQLNKKRQGIHSKDKEKFTFSILEVEKVYEVVGQNIYGEKVFIGATVFSHLAEYFCEMCNINGHHVLMKNFFTDAARHMEASFTEEIESE